VLLLRTLTVVCAGGLFGLCNRSPLHGQRRKAGNSSNVGGTTACATSSLALGRTAPYIWRRTNICREQSIKDLTLILKVQNLRKIYTHERKVDSGLRSRNTWVVVVYHTMRARARWLPLHRVHLQPVYDRSWHEQRTSMVDFCGQASDSVDAPIAWKLVIRIELKNSG